MAVVPWIPISLTAAFVIAAVSLGIRYAAGQQEAFRAVWRAFAATRGLQWSEASGPWYRRSSDRIEGAIDGCLVRIDTYVVSTGKSHVTFTRLRGELERPFTAKLRVAPRNFLTGVGEILGRKRIPTGDAAFDGRMSVRCPSRALALAAIDESVRTRVLALDRPVSIQVQDREVKVWWRGQEKVPQTLDAGCQVTAASR